jgi:hypothetical protein
VKPSISSPRPPASGRRHRVEWAAVEAHRAPGTGEGEPEVVRGCRGIPHRAEPAHRDLDAGRARRGADEPVGDAQRRAVGRTGHRDTGRERAAPPLILHGRREAGRLHPDAAAGARRR